VGWAVGLAIPALATLERTADDLLVQTSQGVVTVGIHRAKGGAITWLSWTGHPENVVNHHDPGRLVQQSY